MTAPEGEATAQTRAYRHPRQRQERLFLVERVTSLAEGLAEGIVNAYVEHYIRAGEPALLVTRRLFDTP